MPLYDKIIDDVMGKIKLGELKEGDMLPTEMELAEMYNVSRPTVRVALQKIANEGYLQRVKGRGTFIRKPKIVQESTRFIESYNQEMLDKGLTPKTEVLELRVTAAPEPVAKKLNIQVGDKVIKLKRIRYAKPDYDESPVVLTTVYIPYDIAPNLLHQDLEKESLYDVLDRQGVVIQKVERELEIKLIYGKTARLLNTKPNSPAHFISSVGYSSSGRPVEYAESFYPADRNKFLITITR